MLDHALCSAVAELIEICFPLMPDHDQLNQADLEEIADIFPEGTILALDGERVVGMGTGIFLNIDFDNLPSTENDLLYTNDTINHSNDGAYYYGFDLAVHPDYRRRGIGRQIYKRRKALVMEKGKLGFTAAAVLPGYAKHKKKIDIHAYLNLVKSGEVFDSTLSMQMRNGFRVIRPIQDFFVYPKSDNWSALILWDNPELQK